jgi:hypothetical protein
MFSKDQHRLDELAWLIEDGSMCSSISVIDNKFYIAANEFSTGTEERNKNKQLDFICKIMGYFRDISTQNLDEITVARKRDELIQLICRSQIGVATFGRMNIPEKILEDVIKSSVLLSKKLPETDNVTKDESSSHLAMGFGLDTYRRIRKIENAIDRARKNDFTAITEEQLKAFQSFKHSKNKDSDILFYQPSGGSTGMRVHAEMHILNQIVNMVEGGEIYGQKEIYVGISKRCCLNCHHMIEAANEILQEHNVVIKVEGSHDIDYSTNWMPPRDFSSGINSINDRAAKKQKAEETLGYRIGKNYALRIAQAKESADIAMRHDRSDSEHSLNAIEKIQLYRTHLEEDLKAFKRRGNSDSETAKMLELGISLCETDPFKDLFEVLQTEDKKPVIRSFLAMLSEINQKMNPGREISTEELLKFLKDPDLSNREISQYFNDISLEDLTLRTKTSLKTGGEIDPGFDILRNRLSSASVTLGEQQEQPTSENPRSLHTPQMHATRAATSHLTDDASQAGPSSTLPSHPSRSAPNPLKKHNDED